MAKLQYTTLSNRTVAALNVERDTVFWDPELKGFGVRVYPTGGKLYIAQARGPYGAGTSKRPRRVTVGRYPVLDAEQARQRAALIIARIKAGEDPVPPAAPGEARRRPDRDRPGQALSRGACRGALQAEDAEHGAQRRQPPHHAGPRQAPAGSGGAQARHGSARESLRDPRHGEHDGEER